MAEQEASWCISRQASVGDMDLEHVATAVELSVLDSAPWQLAVTLVSSWWGRGACTKFALHVEFSQSWRCPCAVLSAKTAGHHMWGQNTSTRAKGSAVTALRKSIEHGLRMSPISEPHTAVAFLPCALVCSCEASRNGQVAPISSAAGCSDERSQRSLL